jgi:hypothetical protein
MRGYLMADFVGCQLVLYLKSLGYNAFLNPMQRCNAPLTRLAWKAGLGQIGRNNLYQRETTDLAAVESC